MTALTVSLIGSSERLARLRLSMITTLARSGVLVAAAVPIAAGMIFGLPSNAIAGGEASRANALTHLRREPQQVGFNVGSHLDDVSAWCRLGLRSFVRL